MPQIEKFKKQVFSLLPQFSSLLNRNNSWLTDQDWAQLLKTFEQDSQRKKLTVAYLNYRICQLKKISQEEFMELLALHKPLPREVKKRPAAEDKENQDNRSSRPSRRVKEEILPNPLVTTSLDMTDFLKSTGVEERSLNPATPTKINTSRFKSPGGTKYKPASKIVTYNRCRSLFSPCSPVKIAAKPRENLSDLTAALNLKQKSTISFTVTPKTVEKGIRQPRYPSQHQLMTRSAKGFFEAQGLADKDSLGKLYHLYHLIGLLLGGEQAKENLIPATAAANFNVLEAVELMIYKTLKKDHTADLPKAFQITITLLWDDEISLIPEELIYTIQWEEKGHPVEQIFNIYPKSFQRYNSQILKSFEALRTEEMEPTDSNSLKP